MILYKNLLNNLIKLNFISNFFQILRPKFTILYYHGIKNDIDFDKLSGPNKHLFVKKSEFIEQMNYLEKKKIDVISLDDLHNVNFRPPKHSVILTFDDGYKDNLNIVYPILKEKNFPFIIYLVSKIFIDDPWVWWIETWSQIEKISEILFEGKNIKLNSEFSKTRFFFKLKKKLKFLKIDEQKTLVKKIFNLKKLSHMKSIFLSIKDVEILIKDNLVTIGSHTHEHLSLKKFDKDIVGDQIKKNKNFLEEKFKISVRHFSFPYGQNEDINFYEDQILKRQNFFTGVTTLEYTYKKFNKYYLSRCSIGPYININDFNRKILGVDRFFKKLFFK